jgi:hypothetical protein
VSLYRINTNILVDADDPKEALLLFAGFLLSTVDASEVEDEECELASECVVDGFVEVGLLKKDS